MALSLTVKIGETVSIGPDVEIDLVERKGAKAVQIRFRVPPSLKISRHATREIRKPQDGPKDERDPEGA